MPSGAKSMAPANSGTRLLRCSLEQRTQQRDSRRAVTPGAAIGRLPRFPLPGREPLDGQVEEEFRPVLDQIHPLLITARVLVLVVAFDERAHRQQILDGDPILARVRIGGRQAVLEIRHDARVGPQESAVDRDPDQHPGERLRRRPRVAQLVGAARIEVVLVQDAVVARDDNARDLLERARSDDVRDLLERRNRIGMTGDGAGAGDGCDRERDSERLSHGRAGGARSVPWTGETDATPKVPGRSRKESCGAVSKRV